MAGSTKCEYSTHGTQINRLILLRVLNAGKEQKAATYILFPSALYGASAGPIKALGVIQLLMYEKVKELGFVPYIGDGTTRFNTVSLLHLAYKSSGLLCQN
jgi:hypothetical protein